MPRRSLRPGAIKREFNKKNVDIKQKSVFVKLILRYVVEDNRERPVPDEIEMLILIAQLRAQDEAANLINIFRALYFTHLTTRSS